MSDDEILEEIRRAAILRRERFKEPLVITDAECGKRISYGLSNEGFTRLSDFYERNEKHFKKFWVKKHIRELRSGIGPGAYRPDTDSAIR